MSNPDDSYFENYVPGQARPRNDLEERVETLESAVGTVARRASSGMSVFYCFGASLAMVISWTKNGSLLSCIWHGVLSWGYVAYYAIVR